MVSLDFKHIRSFVDLAKTENMTQSAENLGYAQSTVSSHLNILEKEFELLLFDRIGKKLKLTEDGQEFLLHCKKLLSIYDTMAEIKNSKDSPIGNITIAAPESLLAYELEPYLKKFKTNHPQINIRVKHESCYRIPTLIANGDIDLAFFVEHNYTSKNLSFFELSRHNMYLVGDTLENIKSKKHTLYLGEKECAYRKLFDSFIIEHNLSLANTIEMWSIEAIKKMVISESGVSLLPQMIIRDVLSKKHLKAEPLDASKYSVGIYVAYKKNSRLSKSTRLFLNTIGVSIPLNS